MKKHVIELERGQGRSEAGQDRLLRKDWRSPGVKAAYWSGSPWRAVGMMFQREPTV